MIKADDLSFNNWNPGAKENHLYKKKDVSDLMWGFALNDGVNLA